MAASWGIRRRQKCHTRSYYICMLLGKRILRGYSIEMGGKLGFVYRYSVLDIFASGSVLSRTLVHCKVPLMSYDVVCLSVTKVYCDKTTANRITPFSLQSS